MKRKFQFIALNVLIAFESMASLQPSREQHHGAHGRTRTAAHGDALVDAMCVVVPAT